jgi:hypothetical protein
VRPADRVVVVGQGAAELVDVRGQELRGLQVGDLGDGDLVQGALRRALGGGAVVADDGVDQGVVQHPERLDGVDEAAEVVVGVLQEPGVDLHLAGQHRLELLVHVLPGRDLLMPPGELGVLGDDAELLLAGERLLRSRSQPWSKRPLYRSAQSLGTWWGAWVAPGAK